MNNDIVEIKGVNDGLLISLDPNEEWLTVTGELANRIDQKQSFYSGARITVDFGSRPVPRHEMTGLKALLERRGMSLVMVLSDSATTTETAVTLDIRTAASSEDHNNQELPINPEEEGEHAIFVKRTLRSGRTVHTMGNVVVVGDVNPGAEIVAAGDVIVWGHLRGNVHAGANGDESARVCALEMTPTQLRIAGYITTSPPGKRKQTYPEVALIRDNQIVVEAWKT